MARRPRIPDAEQPEFSFGLDLPSNPTVNEGPAAPAVATAAPPANREAPSAATAPETAPAKLNRKQRRAAAKQKTADAPAPAAPPVVPPAKKPAFPAPAANTTATPPAPAPDPATAAAIAPAVTPAPAADAPAAPKPRAVAAPRVAPKVTIRPADAKQPTPFETLLHHELGRVFNFCLRLTQDAALADDLTQDVFVNAAKHLPEATSEAPTPHGLTRDAIDLFRRDRRYGRPRRALVETEAAPTPMSRAEPIYNLPAVWHALPDDHRALLAAMGTLDADDRVILVLKDIEGRSYADAGEILEMSESSVRSRVSAARERLHAAVRRLAEQKKP